MNAYVYQAALICEECAQQVMDDLRTEARPGNKDDSEHWPQGPYPDGAGEADCPQHCDHCGVFLENPLTGDGEKYVIEATAKDATHSNVAGTIWRDYYDYLFN